MPASFLMKLSGYFKTLIQAHELPGWIVDGIKVNFLKKISDQ